MLFEATFKALGDPTRRRILELLRRGEMSAGELGSPVRRHGATISHHLSVLKAAGLVSDEKRGKYIYYSLDTSVMEDIFAWLACLCGPQQAGTRGRAQGRCTAKGAFCPRAGAGRRCCPAGASGPRQNCGKHAAGQSEK